MARIRDAWALAPPALCAALNGLLYTSVRGTPLASSTTGLTLVLAVLVALVLALGLSLFSRRWGPLVVTLLLLALLAAQLGLELLLPGAGDPEQLLRFVVSAPGRVAWLLLIAAGAALLGRRVGTPTGRRALLSGALALGFAVVAFSGYVDRRLEASRRAAREAEAKAKVKPSAPKPVEGPPMPDIYYIILDGYGRADILRRYYTFDNEPFLRELQARGFYVARQSRANYGQTALSMASSLNMDFLHHPEGIKQRLAKQGQEFIKDSALNRRPLYRMINRSEVASKLRSMGYGIISIPSTYNPVELSEADSSLHLRIFRHDAVFLELVAGFRFIDRSTKTNAWHRQEVLDTFESLASVPAMRRPTFTVAHLMVPHPPFVFDQDGGPGEELSDEPIAWGDANHYRQGKPSRALRYRRLYARQLAFVNAQVLRMVDRILEASKPEPIIVLQGDHGPASFYNHDVYAVGVGLEERYSILNAFHLPGGGVARLYPSITPVNTFRVILSHYFDFEYSPLADESYFATWDQPYDLMRITDKLGPARKQRAATGRPAAKELASKRRQPPKLRSKTTLTR